jgi:hypothetical protein
MASRVVRVLKRQQFTVPASGTSAYTTTLPIAENIDVSPFKEAVAIARLHSAAAWTSPEYLEFSFREDGYTDEDPTLTFTGNRLNPVDSLKFSYTTELPTMTTQSLTTTSPLPSMIKVDLKVSHGDNSTDMVFVLSLDLVLRD